KKNDLPFPTLFHSHNSVENAAAHKQQKAPIAFGVLGATWYKTDRGRNEPNFITRALINSFVRYNDAAHTIEYRCKKFHAKAVTIMHQKQG
ncbi:MAG: hypothetical protein LBJ89_04680, partial [Holosporales bacterium]|nr:hypothetical protein [Holosporales bacterium]